MKISLQTKVAVIVALVIISVSLISTYQFISAHSRSKEQGRVIRGMALSYALSKAAEEGLINEDLDLIKKASNIIMSQDVILVQVYSNIWEPIDAFPFNSLKEPPGSEAVRHFNDISSPMYLKKNGDFDFYSPILFKATENSAPMAIGFVRVILSSSSVRKEISRIVLTNVLIAVVLTLFAIVSINMLLRRLVIRPVISLYKSVAMFKNGTLPFSLT